MAAGKAARGVAVMTLTLLVAAMTACGSAAPAPAPPAAPASPAAPMPAAGTVTTVTIPATTSGFQAREAHLYLPPAYRAGQGTPLPVLVMLSGVPGDTGDWFAAGDLAARLDAYAAGHDGLAPIVVAPDDTGAGDEDLLCMDSPLAKVDTYLSQDVPRWVGTQLHADPDTAHWAVGGLSYGGTCAYELAVRHPSLFPTFLDFSGENRPMHDTVAQAIDDVFAGDADAYARQDPLAILAHTSFPSSAGVLAAGDEDEPYHGEQQEVLAACRRAGMSVQWRELPGGHEWSLWTRFFQDSLPWLGHRQGLDGAAR